MVYKIVEISTDKATDETYVLVYFWKSNADRTAGKPPAVINDFIMQLRPEARRVITNANGWLLRGDGVFVDPEQAVGNEVWQIEVVMRDLPDEINANIQAYWKRATKRADVGDKTDRRIKRDASDPHNILWRAEVKALKGVVVAKTTL